MKVVSIKALISGVTGFLGAIAAVTSGLTQMFIPIGFGLFMLTMFIQYGSIKFKVVTTLTTLFGLTAFYFGGMNV